MHVDLGAVIDALPFLWTGFKLTCLLAVIAIVAGIALGIVLAIMRLSGIAPLAWFSFGYVNLLRAVPLILVLFWFYLLMPLLIGRPIGAFTSAIVAFIMFEAAYYAEIIRAGIESVSRAQQQAALSTGLTRAQVMQHIVLPQALTKMLPVLLTQAILLFMDTSLVIVVGLRDFMASASIVATRDGRVIEIYVFVAAVYFVICFGASRLVYRLQTRLRPA